VKLTSAPGRGTTFTILFPASEAEREAPVHDQASPSADRQGEGTVLLVDDEETIRKLGTRILRRLGFQVLLAADGREALRVYAEHRDEIVLVLLDLTMPHMDGEETFHALRRLNPDLRVVMSSGYTEQDVSSRFSGEGPAGFLQKPYTLALVEERLRAVLGD
jgi:two-component system cell cycle sensor histidine kinase/response regulator CckA